MSRNTALESLDCSWNQLTELDVGKNTALAVLLCWSTWLTELDLTNNTHLLEEIAKYEVIDSGSYLQVGQLIEEENYWDPLVLEMDFTVTVLPEGMISFVIPEKADNVAISLSGAKNVSVKAGETIGLKISDYQFYPEGSLINGRGRFEDATYGFWGWNYVFLGRSDTYWGEEEGESVFYITSDTPDYYPMQIKANYRDKYTGEKVEIRSDIFILTVLNEDGSEPEVHEPEAAVYPFAGATVGETVQINWYISNGYGPYRSVFRVEKDGNVLDEWIYESDTERDTFTVTAAGEYVIYVTVTDAMNLSATAQKTLTVTEPGPLNLKKIELSPDSVLGKTYEGQLYWYLESEGGYGDKKTDVYLLRADTGEEECVLYLTNTGPQG